jgi:hypothetical protein
MISYIIQTGVTFIFGPLLALLCVIYGVDLADSSFTESNKPYSKLLRWSINLSRSAQIANSLTTLSVLIASLIRIQQLPPVAELTFIKILSLYQWLVSIGISASYWSVFGKSSVQYSLLRFYIIVVFGSYIAVVFTNGYSSFDVDILDSITWHCVADWHYPAPDLRASSDDNGIGNMTIASWPTYLLLAALSYLVLVFIILYFEEWLEKVYNIFRYKVFALCKRLGADPKKLLSSLCIVFVTALWTFGTTWTLRDLQLQRQQLQLVSGNAYQDSQWGFGQVTAMFLWGPMCGDIFLITFGWCRILFWEFQSKANG